ncbi:MAG: penicillin-binding protein activator [Gemmatimonadota bacterium]|nr:penicillin-binding protein activator [Gemmatimonadota bacterium]
MPDSADPALEVGASTLVQREQLRRLLAEAQFALDAGDFEAAKELWIEVESSFAAVPGSSQIFWMRAQAAQSLGNPEEALAAVRQFRILLPRDDLRLSEVAVLEGEALVSVGRPAEAIGIWTTTAALIPDDGLLTRISEYSRDLSEEDLLTLLETAQGPFTGPLSAEVALRRYVAGDLGLAEEGARTALQEGLIGRSRRIAEGILTGDMGEFLVVPRIGVILPISGSPRLREFADEIQDGIRIALEQFGQAQANRAETELVIRDNGGNVQGVREAVAALDSADVLGFVGPLQGFTLEEVARLNGSSVPVISPTSPLVPAGATSVYSLAGDDPSASRALAQYALASELNSAVVIYPETRAGIFETFAFSETFQSSGGLILAEIGYATGATFFEEELRQVESLMPHVLVLPLPSQDIELMAPQVTFFGIDSLEVRILGTAGWSDSDMLARVDTRHTNGVITSSPRPPDGESEGHRAFVQAYEAFHQRTLPSSVPELGYDAAVLLLEGIRVGARTPRELLEALEQTSNFPGATGSLSVEDGRIQREHFLVCLQDRRTQGVAPGQRSDPIFLPPLPDPETDSIPEGAPDRIVGFRCPVFGPSTPSGR